MMDLEALKILCARMHGQSKDIMNMNYCEKCASPEISKETAEGKDKTYPVMRCNNCDHEGFMPEGFGITLVRGTGRAIESERIPGFYDWIKKQRAKSQKE